jgi:hypothetical protein
MISEMVSKFIQNNMHLIEQNNFSDLYHKADTQLGDYQISELNMVLSNSGIDQLSHLEVIPKSMFFRNGDITEFDLPSNINGIGSYAFDGCINLKRLNLNKCLYIQVNGFAGCSELEEVHIPDCMKTLYCSAFENCVSLKKVTYNGTKEQFKKLLFDDTVFLWCSEELVIYCSDGKLKNEGRYLFDNDK